ncbi:hypothetical protein ACFY5C_01170 [Streptomyces sp. NPDC012935]
MARRTSLALGAVAGFPAWRPAKRHTVRDVSVVCGSAGTTMRT